MGCVKGQKAEQPDASGFPSVTGSRERSGAKEGPAASPLLILNCASLRMDCTSNYSIRQAKVVTNCKCH